MKGVVFVELLAMAESLVGEDAVDDVLDTLELSSGGAFTSVGNYPCSDLIALVSAFSDATGYSAEYLQMEFGKWIFAKFAEGYKVFFEGKDDPFAMLEAIEGEVHVEVAKLYPEAELPSFTTERVGPDRLVMTYASQRPLVDFCHGMILACLDHFGTSGDISKTLFRDGDEYGARFDIRLSARMAA